MTKVRSVWCKVKIEGSREKVSSMETSMFPNPSCHLHTSRYLLVFCSKTFVDALQRAGAQATLILFEGKTHTDLFLQVSDVPDISFMHCLII
jgi:hypothetical protein